MGWILAPREVEVADKKPPQKLPSRWSDWVRGHKEEPPCPEPGPLGYLTPIFERSGKLWFNGSGFTPVPWSELKALGDVTNLTSRDVLLLRRMSEEFLIWYRRGADPLELAPPEPGA